MMRTMRASAKWIMAIVAVSFVGWMIFEVGMNVTGQGASGPSDAIGRVDGTKIGVQAFYAAVRNAQEQQRQFGSLGYTLDEQRDLEDQVFESFVQQIVLQQEYQRRGIFVTDQEIAEAAQTMPLPEMLQVPEFQTDGQFDFAKYDRFLRSQADPNFLLALESRYRDELPQRKLIERLTADVYVSDGELWQTYRDVNDSVSVRLVTILPGVVVRDEDVELTAQNLAQYYRTNRESYRRPARAHLSFITLSRVPNSSDSAVALQRARDVLAELRAGTDFADVAARESADSSTRQSGGDLGEVTRGQHTPAFADAALALRPGELSQPVVTEFGYHIIRLESKSGDSYRARHILIPVELQGDHLREVDALGDSLDVLAAEQTDPTMLDSAAAALGVAVAQTDPLLDGQRLRVGQELVPDVSVWAFEALDGETSHVIETDRAYYVFRLDRLDPEGIPPLEAIEEEVRLDALAERKRQEAERIAAEVREDIRSGMPLENAAVKHGLRAVTLPTFTRVSPNPALMEAPEVVGAAFGLEVGEVGGPIQTERAIFFVQPTDRQRADSAAFAEGLDGFRSLVLQDARQARVRLVFSALRAGADVSDLRRDLARAQREQPQLPFAQNPLGF